MAIEARNVEGISWTKLMTEEKERMRKHVGGKECKKEIK